MAIDMTDKAWQSLGLRLLKWINRLLFLLLLLVVSLFTPIFANVSVLALDAFSKLTLDTAPSPKALVVLGGGLTKKNGDIVMNHYTQSRANTVITSYAQYPLPVITSGAESPWLMAHIKKSLPNIAVISDNASMNTCENAVFTAKLINHHELGASIVLITDRYHMARARRQFAKTGIATTPQNAPIAIAQNWTKPRDNWVHSRRAIYEIIALTRDIVRPQPNCRRADDVSIELIETPRKKPKVFDGGGVNYG